MDSDNRFVINDAEVSFNFFDDEIIIIHLQSGLYFSLRDTAAAIWRTLQHGPTAAEAVSASFPAAPADAPSQVRVFFEQLANADLIIPASAAATTAGPLPQTTLYSTPMLQSFDDLQALLLADIIHDTDENGWPNLADAGQDNGSARAA